jgi:hypothetical protein
VIASSIEYSTPRIPEHYNVCEWCICVLYERYKSHKQEALASNGESYLQQFQQTGVASSGLYEAHSGRRVCTLGKVELPTVGEWCLTVKWPDADTGQPQRRTKTS